jgi:NAD(P)-dependent dehydrogenase (short-subunit alcohol dehydrogenase family)
MNARDRGVLVIGATGGSGAAVVHALHAGGFRVTYTGRRADGLAALASAAPGASGILLDAMDEAAARREILRIDSETPLAAYVHLAGGYAGGYPIDELTEKDWQDQLDRNWTSLRVGASIAFGRFKARRSGSIVTIGSLAGLQGGVLNAPYAVSKASVIAFTRCLAEEGKLHGIRANCIVPGILDTPANRAAMPAADPTSWVAPESMAETIRWLCGPDSSAVNGSVIMMKGSL